MTTAHALEDFTKGTCKVCEKPIQSQDGFWLHTPGDDGSGIVLDGYLDAEIEAQENDHAAEPTP